MAQFTNQAALSYNGLRVLSNITVGTLSEVLSVAKTVVEDSYTTGGTLTYVVSLINSGTAALTGLEVTDDLGGYAFGEETLYPLTYVEGSAILFLDGVQIPAPTTEEKTPRTFSGINLPAGSELILIYQATANEYAPLGTGATIVNTVTVTGAGVDATASATVSAEEGPILTIAKSVSPIPVVDNDTLTYTFLIQNFGATEATDTAKVVVSDTFNPILEGLTAALGGVTLSPTTDYTYDEVTGEFETIPGTITVPAATYAQDPDTGVYTVTPGSVTLTVSGTI